MLEGSSKCLKERGLLTNFCELKEMMKPFGMFNKDSLLLSAGSENKKLLVSRFNFRRIIKIEFREKITSEEYNRPTITMQTRSDKNHSS